MADPIQDMIDALKSIDTGKLINAIVKQNRAKVIKLVTDSQIYQKGIKADGANIRPLDAWYQVYSAAYETYKKALGLYQGHVDLHLSGEFLKTQNWDIDFQSDGFTIFAKDQQRDGKNLTEELRKKYGEFEGLTDESMDALRDDIIIQALRDAIMDKIKGRVTA